MTQQADDNLYNLSALESLTDKVRITFGMPCVLVVEAPQSYIEVFKCNADDHSMRIYQDGSIEYVEAANELFATVIGWHREKAIGVQGVTFYVRNFLNNDPRGLKVFEPAIA